ncbi:MULTISPECIES: hypothetical protein [Paenibacillus]|uniref:hypothetical protein n=1 Tax=Paenibacillus TaxID=44249 RepID=UPI0011A9BBC6|nr:hypothetical protein [Paenibacillus sp. IHBB 10380]
MERQVLIEQARAAGRAAEHNLMLIVRDPERMVKPESFINGVHYLNKMIAFAEAEMKNARRAGRASLKHWFNQLLGSILNPEHRKINGKTI